MRVSRITKALSYIDDELISEADTFIPKKNYVVTTVKVSLAALVACLILAVIFYPKSKPDFPVIFTNSTSATAEVLYAHEVYDHKVFSDYFPTVLADGYLPIGKVYIYENRLEAEFYNHNNQDTIMLTIFSKNLLPADETINKVIFTKDENSDITSYIYVDMGEYVAYYTSEKCDLSTLEGFDKMIKSTK